MTRIGGLPTARGLFRSCRARARPIANVRIVGLRSLFVNVRERAPEVSRRSRFARIRRRRGAHGASGCHGAHRAHGARARKAREIRETCLWLVVSPPSGGKAAGLSGGPPFCRSSASSAARAACSTTPTPPSNPAKPANPAILPHQESPVAQTNPHFGSGPETVKLEKLHFCFSLRGLRHVFTVFAS